MAFTQKNLCVQLQRTNRKRGIYINELKKLKQWSNLNVRKMDFTDTFMDAWAHEHSRRYLIVPDLYIAINLSLSHCLFPAEIKLLSVTLIFKGRGCDGEKRNSKPLSCIQLTFKSFHANGLAQINDWHPRVLLLPRLFFSTIFLLNIPCDSLHQSYFLGFLNFKFIFL